MTDGFQTLYYAYDANGMRVSKVSQCEVLSIASRKFTTTTHEYVYLGGQLVQDTITTTVATTVYDTGITPLAVAPGTTTFTTTTRTLYFSYDASGNPASVSYTNNSGVTTEYYYVTNLQGDVVAIVNSAGTTVVQYTYDAWGKPMTTTGSMSSTLGVYNPLRYRGYVYDTDSGLYYLQSRYYNPTWGRFINADALVSTGQGMLGNNMFAYCLNNPVCMADCGGKDAIYVTSPFLVFGHAELYIQDVEGNWYVTEYVGQGFDASTARVKVYPANMDMVSTMINGGDISNRTYSYIEGDFTRSLNRAFELDGSNYGGYDLVVNNCLHYVKELITYGDFDNFLEGVLAKNSWQIIPKRYHDVLETGRKLGELYEEAKNYVSEMLENIWDWFH